MEKLKLKEIQELIHHALHGKGEIEAIAAEVGVTTQTVRNALNRENVLKLNATDKQILMLAAEKAKPYIEQADEFANDLQNILERK